MICASDVAATRIKSPKELVLINRLLTSAAVLRQDTFEEPRVIDQRFFNFNMLLTQREAIRDLQLLPLKEETLHDTYNSLSREQLLDAVKACMGDEPLVLLPNAYPYQLSKDVHQCILWVQKDDESRTNIILFLARVLRKYEIDDLDVILFERSPTSHSKYVKRSFPLMRHIHVWLRKSSLHGKILGLEYLY